MSKGCSLVGKYCSVAADNPTDKHPRPRPDRPLSAVAAAHRQLLFPIEPEHIGGCMFCSSGRAIWSTNGRSPSGADERIVRPGRLISHRHAAAADGFTRPPECVSQMDNSFPLARGSRAAAAQITL